MLCHEQTNNHLSTWMISNCLAWSDDRKGYERVNVVWPDWMHLIQVHCRTKISWEPSNMPLPLPKHAQPQRGQVVEGFGVGPSYRCPGLAEVPLFISLKSIYKKEHRNTKPERKKSPSNLPSTDLFQTIHFEAHVDGTVACAATKSSPGGGLYMVYFLDT